MTQLFVCLEVKIVKMVDGGGPAGNTTLMYFTVPDSVVLILKT